MYCSEKGITDVDIRPPKRRLWDDQILSPASPFPGQPNLWGRRGRAPGGRLEATPQGFQLLQPPRSPRRLKGWNDSVKLADKRGEPGSSRAAGPPPSPSSGTWAVWAEKLSSCVPFRALAPTPEGTHGALVPVPPGLS